MPFLLARLLWSGLPCCSISPIICFPQLRVPPGLQTSAVQGHHTSEPPCTLHPLCHLLHWRWKRLLSLILSNSERGVTWIPFFRWWNQNHKPDDETWSHKPNNWWSQAAIQAQVFLIPRWILVPHVLAASSYISQFPLSSSRALLIFLCL